MLYWHFFCGICFQELQRSQPRSFCGDGDKTSLNFGRFSLKILFFGACGTKFLCICDGFEVACGLGVVMGTQNPHFWSTLSESKWWEDPGWCAPGHVQLKPSLWIWGGFELGYDLGGAMCSQLGNFGSCLSEPNTTINRATVHMVISIWELNCAFEVDLRSVYAI
jgi:hypothetical protein